MNRHRLLLAAAVVTLGTSVLHAQNNNNVGMPWEAVRAATRGVFEDLPPAAQKAEPFKIFDNVYYVGLETIGSYLIPTNDGLILIDSTYADTADLVLDSVRKLTARQILAGEPLPANPTGHPAAVGSQRINAYFDQIRTAVQDRLAKEQSAAPAPTR